MKSLTALAALVLVIAQATLAKDAPSYDQGVLLSMGSTTCGTAEKGSKSVAGEILGTDSSHKQTEQVLCQEYVLQSDRIVYHIRPTDQKHPLLLPVGESIQFRVYRDKLYLRDPEGDKKERAYLVLSMEPRRDVKTAN